MLGVAAFPSLLYALFCLGLPESPRWLLTKKGDRDGALQVLQRAQPQVPKEEIAAEADEIVAASTEQVSSGHFWTRHLQKPILLAFLIAFFNQMSGINAILYFAPRIFELTGLAKKAALLQSIGIGVTNLVFTSESAHCDMHQPGELVGSQQLLSGRPVQAFRGHAITAAQVAAIGQRHAQVGGGPAVRVQQRAICWCVGGPVVRWARVEAGHRRHTESGQRHPRTCPNWADELTGTISLPSGISDTGINLRLARASGMPMIVIAMATALTR